MGGSGLNVRLSFRRFEVRIEDRPLPGREPRPIISVVIGNSVAMLPVFTDKHEVVLLRQYRPAIEKWIIEAPAGTVEPGEDPVETVARELEEEAGLKPGRIEKVAEGYVSPGYTTEYMHYYIVWDPVEGRASPEEGEVIEVLRVPIDTAFEMAESGQIRDAKTLLLLWALRAKLSR